MKLRVLNPWTTKDPFNRLFEDLLKGWTLISDNDETGISSLAINLAEDDRNYIAEVEVPGIKPEDIDIQVEDRYVTISGHTKNENEKKKKKYHLREIYESSFTRTFMLPGQVDVDNIKADCKDGILTLTMPKSVQSTIKKIKIN